MSCVAILSDAHGARHYRMRYYIAVIGRFISVSLATKVGVFTFGTVLICAVEHVRLPGDGARLVRIVLDGRRL